MGAARFTVVTPECIRLEYSPTGEFVDSPTLFAREVGWRKSTRSIADGAAPVEFEAGRLHVRYAPDGRGFTPETLAIAFGEGDWRPGRRNTSNLGGTLETLDRVRTRVPLPEGLLSRDGWHLLDDSTNHLLADGWVSPRPERVRGNTDWYFFGYGDDFPAALRALGAVAGPAPMPRRYALGSWYSRYWPYTSEEYREIVAEYDRRGYPLDVIVMDMDWHKPGWTGWSWNRELLPDAEQLLQWFHERGLAVTLNLHPAMGVGSHEDQYAPFMRAIGRDPSTGETAPFDAGDRRYAAALFDVVHAALEEDDPGRSSSGVDFWWLDWQQEKFTRSIPDLPNLRWLNYLYFQHTSKHARGCSFSRWAGWGDHRHPVHFSGDAHTGWESLAFQVPFTAAAGNVGCFYWSHDIGGHFGPRLEEATTRWVQFGALSPVLRLHSARSGALDRRPWTYKGDFEHAMRGAFRLRSQLFPYLYTMARRCHTDMLPLCRPMYIGWPREERAYQNPQQYMLGESLLVAPIASPGVGPRRLATQAVWFPPGDAERWHHWETGESYAAGSTAIVAAEIDEIPLFVPGGVPVVTREPTLRMATEPLTKLVIVLYPGVPGSFHEFQLYEDDGISNAHERGEYAVTPIRVWWFQSEVRVEVGIRVGAFRSMVQDREVVVELRGVTRGTHVRVGDRLLGEVAANGTRVSIDAGTLHADEVVRLVARFEASGWPSDEEHMDRRTRAAFGCDAEELDRHVADHAAAMPHQTRQAALALLGIGLQHDGAHARLHGMDNASLASVTRLGAEESRTPLPGGTGSIRVDSAAEPRSPRLGLTMRRELDMTCTVSGKTVRHRYLLEQRTIPLHTLRVAGPFAYDPTKSMIEQRHGPELLSAADRRSGTFVTKDGKPVAWMECPANDYWPQDMHKVCGGHDGEAQAYAMTHVWSPEEQQAALILESGDRMEVWLDDDRVFSSDTAPESPTGVDEVEVVLKKGWTQVMVKTNEGGGGWGARVAIDGRFELRESFDAR